jgi:hypothetical protein
VAATTAVRDPESDPHRQDQQRAEHSDRAPLRGGRHTGETGGRDPAERGMRDLIGAGRSQVGVGGAMRARDVNRPSAEDLAEAERTVTIVRRHWKPPS